MRESNLNVRLKRLVHPPKHTRANSQHILTMLASMISYIGVIQETKEIIDPSDTLIGMDIIKAISEISLDRLPPPEI